MAFQKGAAQWKPRRYAIVLTSVAAALAAVAVLGASTVQLTTEEAKLTASDPGSGNSFSRSVAVEDDVIMIGALGEGPRSTGRGQGAAYIFKMSDTGWSEQEKLIASDGEEGDEFGRSVAVDGNVVIAGAPGPTHRVEGTYRGAAYIFKRNGSHWSEQQVLTASDGGSGARDGASVAVDDGVALVGAPLDPRADEIRGSAYVFTRSGGGWSEQVELTARDADHDDHFGVSVGLDGDVAVVGARSEDGAGSDRGAAYVFTRSDGYWSEQAKLTASDAEDHDWFGHSVALDGNVTIVGAPSEDGAGSDRGAAYVFTRSGGDWSEQTKLTASGAEDDEEFGSSVAVHGDVIVVGATGEDGAGNLRGAAYVFN